MKRSEKNKANRSKQRYPSYHGSESYSQKRWTEMEKHGTTSIVDGWKKTHYKPGLGWANDLAEQNWVSINFVFMTLLLHLRHFWAGLDVPVIDFD
ncbi:hypothetical protein R6Q57_000286 [Mikania cordata]